MTGKKFRLVAALGLLALPVAVAAPAAAVAPAAPSQAAVPSGPGYRVTCYTSHFYWCDRVSSTGTQADLQIHNGPDTGGHDVAYIDFSTNHCGQNVWILTSNGSGGWNWEGVTADTSVGGTCYIPTQLRSDAGVLIKLAVYNYDTGAYMYTNAH
ncbi:hypothetical protein ACIQ9P_38865 [Kitasatospora sp. NPDC094019]|uniref:hypothetical protein n=1 Tax=Kitasatospora sp. NPDC094019 TaxID=3364091 RepID=UPI00380C0C03